MLGLSIALELAQKGLAVAIIARNLPIDKDSTDFCSPWAVSRGEDANGERRWMGCEKMKGRAVTMNRGDIDAV